MLRRLIPQGLLVLAAALVAVAGAGPARPDPVGAVGAPGLICQSPSGRADDRIAVVVSFPGKPLRTACVAAGGNGIDVLRRAGFDPVVHGFGSVGGAQAVCALRDPLDKAQVGCAAGPDCLLCSDPDYWGYHPGYRYSASSASLRIPEPGTVEAWVFGRSRSWSGSRPRAAEICPAAPPPSTAPPTTVSPAGPPPTTAPPSGGGRPQPSSPSSPSEPRPAGGGPSPSIVPPATTAPGPSTTRAASTTSPEGVTAPPAGDGEPEPRGDQAEAAAAVPDGTGGGVVAVTDGGDGSGSPLGPLAATGAVIAAVAALALRARRRRTAELGA